MDNQRQHKLEMRLSAHGRGRNSAVMADPEIRAMIDDDVINGCHILFSVASDHLPLLSYDGG